VARYGGEHKVKSFSCLDQYLCMAFAQLTFRESLRDIEACLRAQIAKLYHMGIRARISRSTLADANEVRDWRIYAEFAQRLIGIARELYIDEPFGVELKQTVYALDSTTIDLCLSVFAWAPFRSTKAAIKLHTLLDLRGNIPSFIHISDGRWHDVNMLDYLLSEPGAFYVMDRAYLDFARLHRFHEAGSFFVTRAKSNLKAQRRYSHPVDRSTGLICDQTVTLTVFYSRQGFDAPLRRIRFKDPVGGEFVVCRNPPGPSSRARDGGRHDTVRPMRELLILGIHLLVTFARLLRPGGVRAVAAESLLLKHQLVISNRSRQRAPNLTSI
jgi:hypothetical protein